MFSPRNAIEAAALVINIVIIAYIWIIVIRALISWVNPDPYNPFVKFLRSITEPVLRLARRVFPTRGLIDLSPIYVIFFLIFLRILIVETLLVLSRAPDSFTPLVVLAIFLYAIVYILAIVINFLIIIIVIRAIVSWISPDPYNPIVRAIYAVTEPILMPLRSIIPIFGGFDFTPIIAILLLVLVRALLIPALMSLVVGLGYIGNAGAI
jgi:YggT family protein